MCACSKAIASYQTLHFANLFAMSLIYRSEHLGMEPTLALSLRSGLVPAGAALLFLIGFVVHRLFLSPLSHVPGPAICKITRLWTAFHDVRLQRNEKIYQWHQKYGPVVLIAPGEVSFSGPAPTREIYSSTGRHPKSAYFDNFKMYGERMIFCALGCGEHREMRKRTFAFYQPTSIHKSSVIDPVRERCRVFLNLVARDIGSHRTIDVFSRCNLYAFDNITGLIYGTKHASHSMDNEDSAERSIMNGWKMCEVWNNLLYNLPTVHGLLRAVLSYFYKDPNFLAAEDKLTEWNSTKLAAASQDTNETQDYSLVQHLQKMKTPDGEPLSTPEIGAEVLDNIHAAQTTVALALTYALWNIASNQEWQEKVREELRSLPIEEDGMPSFANIDKAPVLNACIRESYRVNPLSSGRAERVVPITKEYEGVVLPSGTIVSSSTLALHRSETVFHEPRLFNPDRWLRADAAHLRAMESCYIPFGAGARLCLGKAFANAEVKLLIATILLKHNVSPDERSSTNAESMTQMGTQNALPRGLQCEVAFEPLSESQIRQRNHRPRRPQPPWVIPDGLAAPKDSAALASNV